MTANSPLPLGLQLKRARRAAGLSQAELARRAHVSQPLVSHYERSLGEPGGEAFGRVAAVLGLEVGSAPAPRPAAHAVEPVFDRNWLRNARGRLLASLDGPALRIAHLDRQAVPGISGDLAFAAETRSHVLFAVVDGVGGGDQAAMSALLCASTLLGIFNAAKGVTWPDELLSALTQVGDTLGTRRLTASFVGLLDPRHGELAWASTGFPAPLLRNKQRAGPLRGEVVRAIESGRVELASDWLLLLGTDGVAHLPSRGKDVLWETRETRELVAAARTPKELVRRLATSLDRRKPKPEDDALIVALAAP
jgi:transcriptional regulator with XRE-family HTH domain